MVQDMLDFLSKEIFLQPEQYSTINLQIQSIGGSTWKKFSLQKRLFKNFRRKYRVEMKFSRWNRF